MIKSMANSQRQPAQPRAPSSVLWIAPCMTPEKSVPTEAALVKMAERLPSSSAVYQAPSR